MKPSQIDLDMVKQYLRVDFSDDDDVIEMMMLAAKGWVETYTNQKIKDLDDYSEVCMAILMLTAHFYDNRTIPSTSDTTMEFVLRQTLGMHHIYHKNETVDGGVFNA